MTGLLGGRPGGLGRCFVEDTPSVTLRGSGILVAGTDEWEAELDGDQSAVVLRARDGQQQEVPIVEVSAPIPRRWVICPGCGDRRAALFLIGVGRRRWVGRRCAGLSYRVEHLDPGRRAALCARRLRCRLGGSGSLVEPIPDRPRGMHRRTYVRLVSGIQKAERKYHASRTKAVASLGSQIALVGSPHGPR